MKAFVSIVGTQAMAVLNPLMALVRHDGELKPDRVVLLNTSFSRDFAVSAKKFLVDGEIYPEEAVQLIGISSSLVAENNLEPVDCVVRDIQKDAEIIFNLAGGMNFQIAAVLHTLDLEKSRLVYPENSGIHLYRWADGRIRKEILALPPALDILKLFSVQGITWKADPNVKLTKLLANALRDSNLQLPQDALYHVQFAENDYGIAPWSLSFDLVFNEGNRLCLLAVLPSGSDNKERARKLIDIASGRTHLGHLYDRRIGVLTNATEIADRLRIEAGNKIDVIEIPQNSPFPKLALSKFLGGGQMQNNLILGRESVETGKKTGNAISLYLPLGKNLIPSLKAIWTRKPATACLLYTQQDRTVAGIKETLKRHAALFPCSRLEFIPVSFSGEDILDIPCPTEGSAEVNITPGTKSQGAFLALWAKFHGAKTYSLLNDPPELVSLGSDQRIRISLPRPETLLVLSGTRIKSPGTSSPECWTPALHSFLAGAIAEGLDIKGFPEIELTLQDGRAVEPKNGKLRILDSSGKVQAAFPYANRSGGREGGWFESLVAYAAREAARDKPQINIKTAWTDEQEKILAKRFGTSSLHLSEVDVVIPFEGNYHLFSCKATTKLNGITALLEEVRAQASLFERNTIPYIAHLEHSGEPQCKDGVWVLGCKTLTDTQVLRTLMHHAQEKRQTTAAQKESQ